MRRSFIVLAVVSAFVLGIGSLLQARVLSTVRAEDPPASAPESGAARVLLHDGRVLIIGGDATGTLRVARSHHAAVVLSDGRVLVTGGFAADGVTSSAEIYDPLRGSWSDTSSMAEARVEHTASLLADGRVLIAGGSSLELYDPAQGTFAFAGVLSPPRTGHAAAVLADGRVLLAGGFSGGAALDLADVYDPLTQLLTPTRGGLIAGRAKSSATTLHDGRVVIAGGHDERSELRSVELYDPAADAFATADRELTTARSGHSATLLSEGEQVLITGGVSARRLVAVDEILDLGNAELASAEPTRASVVHLSVSGTAREGAVVFIPAANAAGNLDQCRNGTLTTAVPCTLGAWVNGNAGGSNAHWLEGDSIAYRLKFTNLSTGVGSPHVVTIEWDTTQGGKHALDYLTTFNRTEFNANPCSGVSGCTYTPPATPGGLGSGTFDTEPIPADPGVTGAGVTPAPGVFALFGGNITGVSAYTVNGSYAGNSSTKVTIQFTTSVANPVLSWSAHIATRLNWGTNSSAVAISGSPYHMRLLDLDGGGGNQDRSLSNDAVIFPGSITIVKDVANGTSPSDFSFTTTGPTLAGFTLDDDGNNGNELSNTKLFSNILEFGTARTVTEANPAPTFALTALSCAVVSQQQSPGTATGNVGTRTATINIKEGEDATCTFVNTLQNGTLRVFKTVLSDNGGTRPAGDFSLHVKSGGTDVAGSPQPGSATGTVYSLNAGSYTVSEDDPTNLGYTQTGFSGDCNSSGVVTVVAGVERTCTITNNDSAATLIVIKHVVNDHGGTAAAADFTLSVTGSSPSPASFAGAESPGTTVSVNAGAYGVTETGPSGYAASFSADCTGTIAVGQTKTCTVTNNDIQPQLIVIKHVVNDHGGTAAAAGFTLSVTGSSPSPASFAGAELPGTTVSVNAGAYGVTESGPSGYAASFSADCTGTIAVGQTKTCTVTNNDIQPQLIVIKHVINNNGGAAAAADFTLSVTGSSPSPASFAGAESPGTTVSLHQGAYSVGESGPSGYAASFSANCTGTITVGQTRTCTVTNDDEKADPSIATTMSWILVDSATLTNFRPGASDADDATIVFRLYGPSVPADCGQQLLIDSRTVTGVTTAGPFATPTGIPVTAPGTYRWIAEYSGDAFNNPRTTTCGEETHTILVGEPQ